MARKRTIERTISMNEAVVKAYNKSTEAIEEVKLNLPKVLDAKNERKVLLFFDKQAEATHKGLSIVAVNTSTKKYKCAEEDYIKFCEEHGEVIEMTKEAEATNE